MKKDPWFERGLDELKQGHWFDGFQMLKGAIQRTILFNNPDHAKMILSNTIPLFATGKQEKLACNLGLSLITSIRPKIKEHTFADLIPIFFALFREENLENCIQTFCNQIMVEKAFQVSEFLSYLDNFVSKTNFNKSVISDLYFCYAGILCYKKDYVSCFETLNSWYNELSSLSPKMRAYLTLAEINAYEIESCGKYLHSIEEPIDSYDSESKNYYEIASRIFGAVQTNNHSEFHSTISDYSDLINSKKDGLLKGLCDGLFEIFSGKSQSGLLSLFRP
ncbi:MAG: hypothetical protein JSW11_12095 [Candidatus Heimdallarchaeota archaeon]|nr:MAG: hypothetical protein JSW11_12095 [Candidatus Heimdallarchaeota archaeon]